jgi:ATP-binding cassette subfamily B protein
MRNAQANIQIVGGSPRFIIEAAGMILIAGLAYLLANRPEGIYSALPLMGVLVLSAQRLLPLLQQSYASWAQIRSSRATLVDTLELLNQPIPEHIDNSSNNLIKFNNKISIRNLCFQYQPEGKWVLKDVNFCINKGSRIGVIGKTGSGKSTFLDLVMGLLVPTKGNFYIDDQEITSENSRAWQRYIAHVPQTIFLADITILENIAFGIPYELIDRDRVKDVASKAQIAEVIEGLPNGYETFVCERGVRLSGGQRQRIGIARALYKNVDVIVFDEATSALDNQTERAVMDVIDKLSNELTIIIVAHRITTLKNCNQIIEIDNGQIKFYNN